MNAKKFYLLVVMVLVTGLLPQRNVSADMGPKPSMSFMFISEIPDVKLTMTSWSIKFCYDADCFDGYVGQDYDFRCEDDRCETGESNSVKFNAYYQLEITFSDGITRKSNIFSREYFAARYKVTIKPDSLLVEELHGGGDPLTGIINFCAVTLVLAVVVAVVYGVLVARKKDGTENPKNN